jgi:hypothetical protein
MRRAIDHALISTGALLAVLVVLVGFDPRVRDAMARLVTGAPSAEVAVAGAALQQFTGPVLDAVREQSLANAPLMIFVVVATVLMVFMVRT